MVTAILLVAIWYIGFLMGHRFCMNTIRQLMADLDGLPAHHIVDCVRDVFCDGRRKARAKGTSK